MSPMTAGTAATTTERALHAIRDLRAKVNTLERRQSEPVAIVGMGCHFPGAQDLLAFWDLLLSGIDPLGPVPEDRWDIASLYSPDPRARGKTVSREGGYLPGLDTFDAAFFGITPREAPFIDPRQRLILETAWEALEDAGIPVERLIGSPTSVVVGTLTNDYNQLITADDRWVSASTGTGTSNSIIANRLSYVLDLRGPSLTVDTACSGSLLALHLACQTLRTGEATLALCGGVAVNLVPAPDICFSRMGALSPRGRCHTFDAASDGMARSEGAGMVVLKLLSQAQADGDRIYAVIRATAVNHDGRSNGIAAPNGQAQEALLQEAYDKAGLAPHLVQYVEAHGTGTIVGDRIELQALAAVLGRARAPDRTCVVGSVKSNIGHTESAAGIAGVIKTALALKHRVLPGNLHFETPHPALAEATFPLDVRTSAGPFPFPDAPLIAGVSAFSFGGANVHVVLEEPPAAPHGVAEASQALVLPLSARAPEALQDLARAYVSYLRAADAPDLSDICATNALRRTHHAHRLAVAGTNRAEMAAQLEAYLAGEDAPQVVTGCRRDGEPDPPVAFVFSGQGSQWLGMGRDLYAVAPAFRNVIDRCEGLFQAEAGWSLVGELNATPETSRLDEIDVVQPTLFALQAGLIALWRDFGVMPDVVIGQSMGEIAAAHAAGILSLEDAARVILTRSRLLRSKRGVGATAVVGLPVAEVEAALASQADRLSVAGVTSFTSTLIAGETDAVHAYLGQLEAAGTFCRLLENVDVPAHSPAMDSLRPQLEAELAAIAPQSAATRFLSTVTLRDEPGPNLGAAYWGRNLREPFRVADAVARLAREQAFLFLELSPHPVLAGAVRQTLQHLGADGIALGSLARETDGPLAMAAALAGLWVQGHGVEWARVMPADTRCVSLPSYPWQREHFWVDQIAAGTGGVVGSRRVGGHPLLGTPFAAAQGGSHFWDGEIDTASLPWLRDHALSGMPVLPGAAYLEIALAAARQALPWPEVMLTDAGFDRMLLLPEGEIRHLQVSLARTGGAGARVEVLSRRAADDQDWTLHARIDVHQRATAAPDRAPLATGTGMPVALDEFYGRFTAGGLEYGPVFQGVRALRSNAGAAWAELALPDGVAETGFGLHPALLDSAFQVVAAIGVEAGDSGPVYLPQGVGALAVYGAVPARVFVHAVLTGDAAPGAPHLSADVTLTDVDGAVLAIITDLRLRRVDEMRPAAEPSVRDSLYGLEWHAQPRPEGTVMPDAAGLWVLSGQPEGLADGVVDALRQRRGEVRIVPPDGDIAAEIAAAGDALRGVVLLGAGGGGVPDAICDAVALRALSAVQALVARGGPARLFMVTRGAISCGADDPAPNWADAPLWGFGRAVGIEHGEIWGAQIDLEPVDTPDQGAALMAELLELGDDREIALRAGQRLVGRLARLAKPAVAPEPVLFRADASYLITGGLTGLGLETAHWMAVHGARRLVIIARTPLPPRATWATLAADSEPGQRVAAVRALEALGATVRVEAFDVADEDRLAAFLTGYQDEAHPPIRGIIHAAGVIQDSLLLQMTPADVAAVMRPKVAGAWALHRLTAQLSLDFFVLYSSASSVLGQMGQANYGAANAFEDALAWHRRAQGLPATAINWGPWAQIGLFARLGLSDRAGLTGIAGITPTQGMAALEYLMALGTTQALVLNADWAQVPQSPRLSLLQAVVAAGPDVGRTGDGLATLLLMEPAARKAELRTRLGEIVAAVLRFDPAKLDHRRPLTTLGMDSIMAVEIRNRIKRQFDLTPSIVDLFTGSVSKLTDWLEGELDADARLAALLDEIEDLPASEVEALLASEQRVA